LGEKGESKGGTWAGWRSEIGVAKAIGWGDGRESSKRRRASKRNDWEEREPKKIRVECATKFSLIRRINETLRGKHLREEKGKPNPEQSRGPDKLSPEGGVSH